MMENSACYLAQTPILDYKNSAIEKLVHDRMWRTMPIVERVKSIYMFVRDEIAFGYNASDNLKASDVLADGYGQCNTKATLLMALLRAVGVPCRIHGFTIDKALQKGAISGIWYALSPQNILHSWVEVWVNDTWYFLEGVILDKKYLAALQKRNPDCTTFCGFGAYTDDLQQPAIDWNLNNTYIQDKGINQDFGVFDSPDEFYALHQQKLNWFKRLVFERIARHLINANVRQIRG